MTVIHLSCDSTWQNNQYFQKHMSFFFPHAIIKYITFMAVLWAHSFPLAFTTKVKILPFQNFRYKFPALRELYSSTSRALHYSSASKRFQKVLSLLWYHKQCKGRHDCVSPAFTESPVSSEHHTPHISCCQTRKNKFLLLDQRHHGQ